jgi:hypothetical protein
MPCARGIFPFKVPEILMRNPKNRYLVLMWMTRCSSKINRHVGRNQMLSKDWPLVGGMMVIPSMLRNVRILVLVGCSAEVSLASPVRGRNWSEAPRKLKSMPWADHWLSHNDGSPKRINGSATNSV